MGEVVRLHYPRPSPRSAVLPIEAVDAHRDIWCRHYDGCLDVAVRKDWRSWSCASCPLKGEVQEAPELRIREHSIFADVPEAWAPSARPTATTRVVYRLLSNRPRTLRAIARRQYRQGEVLDSLRKLAAKGLVVETSKGWKRTGERICSVCRQCLPAKAYDADCASVDGLHATCRECRHRRRRA